MHRKRNRSKPKRLRHELLEPRQLLAVDVIINEFVASNDDSLLDGFGESSDWIELYNRGDEVADLTGYHLTDEATNLSKWTFPSDTSLGGGEYLVVFASGRELLAPDSNGYLHADFKLSADGGYVALTDDTNPLPVVLSEFGMNGQDYPAQETDISYGLTSSSVLNNTLVGPDHPVKVHIPNSGAIGQTWTGLAANEPFDDTAWIPGTNGIGYDIGGFAVQESIGNAIINRSNTDNAFGSIFMLASSPFTNPGRLTRWSMYNNTGFSDFVTPLILRLDDTGNYEIVGIGQTRESNGSGAQTFNFNLQSGDDAVDETYFFGWKDGGNGFNNNGVVPFTNNSTEEVRWFQQHTNYSVGEDLGTGQELARTYSFEAEVEARFYDSEINTSVPTGTTTAYIRSKFNVDPSNNYNSLSLRLKYDDGIVVYLNGEPIYDDFAPAILNHLSISTGLRPDSEVLAGQVVDISDHLNKLVDGENILAVQILNFSNSSSDFLAVAELEATIVPVQETFVGYMTSPTPNKVNRIGILGFVADTKFSVDRGFYTSAFNVDVSSSTPGATIVITTDGSEPTLTNGSQFFDGAEIAPVATVLISTTTTLRAAAFLEDYQPTNVDTHTYVFTADVVQQPGLFSDITDNPVWGPQLENSLLSLPTISIATSSSITQAENETSVELLLPDGAAGFQVDAGIEQFGGTTLSSPKKNLRLSFKEIYGASKLNYDLFEDPSATNEFDQILLRFGSHDTWFWNGPTGNERGAYLRNRLVFDQQLAMGQPAPHGRFVQVYINGRYEGMHHLMERPNDAFMASYFGGSKEDYDSINAGNVTGGDRVRWDAMIAAAQVGDWNLVQQYMDVENFADYLLLEFYAGNDWDWLANQNWSAAGARDGSDGGFKFFAWDNDVKYRSSPLANTVKTTNGSNGPTVGPEGLSVFMRNIPEFRLLLADRVQKHFFNDGVLTDSNTLARVVALENQLALPLIAETARWGNVAGVFTPDSWQASVNQIKTFLDFNNGRNATVLAQLATEGLLPNVDAPAYAVNGSPQHGGQISASDLISLSTPSGSIYFTTDGSDPRATNGAPAGTLFQNAFSINGLTTLKARVFSGGEWSAVSEAEFLVGSLASQSNLRITEINFNPHAATAAELSQLQLPEIDNDKFEFIEVYNSHPTDTINLSNMRLGGGVSFLFGNLNLQAGERGIVVENLAAFEARYGTGLHVLGTWSDRLSNGGEAIVLTDSLTNEVMSIEYGDSDPWAISADGGGATLVLDDPNGTPTNELRKYYRWRGSAEVGGSPGTASAALAGVVINEVLTHTDLSNLDAIELFNPTANPIDIGGWFLSDSDSNLQKFQIPLGTSLGTLEYVVFDESDFNPTPAMPSPNDFDLDAAEGDQVYLVNPDSDGAGTIVFVDQVEFGAAYNGESFGRFPDSNGRLAPMATPTLGTANSTPRLGQLIISEVQYHPESPSEAALLEDPTIIDNDLEFIEIHNPGAEPVSLAGWQLRGKNDYDFDSTITLAPGGTSVVVSFDPSDANNAARLDAFRVHYGLDEQVPLVGAFSGHLSNGFARVSLQSPDQPPSNNPGFVPHPLEDEVLYDDLAPWPTSADGVGDSLHRIAAAAYGNAASSWSAATPTPGTVALVVPSADFDGDSDVDGADFLAWQRGVGPQYGASDLQNWANNFGDTTLPSVAASAAVPAPFEGGTGADPDADVALVAALSITDEATSTLQVIDAADANQLVASASLYWSQQELEITSFDRVDIVVTDWERNLLSLNNGNPIYFDDNAAGHDWYLDDNQTTDKVFNGVDLYTTLAHELEYSLDYKELSDGDDSDQLMGEGALDVLDAVFESV